MVPGLRRAITSHARTAAWDARSAVSQLLRKSGWAMHAGWHTLLKILKLIHFLFQRKRKFPLSPRFPPKLRPRSLPVPWIRTRLPLSHHSQWQEMMYRTQHKWVNRSSTSHPIFFSILKLIRLYTSIVDWYCLPGYPRIFPRWLNKLWIININIIIKIWSNWNLTSMQKIKYGNSNQSEQIF